MNQSEIETIRSYHINVKRGKTRASKARFGIGFASDWLRKWRELY